MNISENDARVRSFIETLALVERLRYGQETELTAIEVEIAVREFTKSTLGTIEDPRVTDFRHFLAYADEYARRQGEPGSYEAAGDLLAMAAKLLETSKIALAAKHRAYYAARNDGEPENPNPPQFGDRLSAEEAAEQARGLLRLLDAFLLDVGSMFLPRGIVENFSADTRLRIAGDRSVIELKIPHKNPQNRASILHGELRHLSVLYAFYMARKNGTNFEQEHSNIYPHLRPGGRKSLRVEVDGKLREVAQSAGRKAAVGEPLTPEEAAIETLILKYTAQDYREKLVELKNKM